MDAMPTEILCKIFEELKGEEVLLCREVNSRWQHVIDGLPNTFWQRKCMAEHPWVYEESYRKADLSWRDLCHSLSLWASVKLTTRVTSHQLQARMPRQCHILGEGIISFSSNTGQRLPGFECDTIIHYNVTTHKELHRDMFPLFRRYSENEKMFVLESNQSYNSVLLVVPKSRKHSNHIDMAVRIPSNSSPYQQWLLFNDFLFYWDDVDLFCYKLIEKIDVTLEKKKTFTSDGDTIMDVVRKGKEMFILTSNATCILLKQLKSDELRLVAHFDRMEANFDPIWLIKSYGFNWSCIHSLASVMQWLPYEELFRRCNESPYIRGNVAILQSLLNYTLDIFYNPHDPNDNEFMKNQVAPDKVISIKEILGETFDYAYVHLLDVIEIFNGHMIILTDLTKITFVELIHE